MNLEMRYENTLLKYNITSNILICNVSAVLQYNYKQKHFEINVGR